MMMVQPLNKTKLNNRGASVIELIIIMAILAVLLSGSIIAFSLLNTSNINQASRTTKSYIEKTRTSAMSVMADEWNFTITKEDEEFKAIVNKIYKNDADETVTEKVEEKVLGARIGVTFISGSSELAMDTGDVLKITFNQSTGGVAKVTFNGTEYKPTENIISVKFTSGNSNATSVKLYFVSGKVELE